MPSSLHSLKATLPQPKFSKGARQRQILVDAIIQSLAETGLDGTTFESIAQRCGLKRPHVVYYFPTRDAMILGAMLQVTACAQAETVKRVETATNTKEQVLAIVDGAFEWARKFPAQVSVLSLFYHGTNYDTSFLKLNQEIRGLGRERIKVVLMQNHPNLNEEVAKRVAFELQFHIIGSILWLRSESKSKGLSDRHEFVRRLALAALDSPHTWLKGITGES